MKAKNTEKNYQEWLDIQNAIGEIIEHARYLMLRWQDEWQYEDRRQYEESLRSACKTHGFTFMRANKMFKCLTINAVCKSKKYRVKIRLYSSAASFTLEELP